MRPAEAAARGEVARLADCRMAVAMDDADYDLDCRRAVGEGVSGGWQGADGGVVPRSGRNSAAGWFDGHRDEHEFICRDGDTRRSRLAGLFKAGKASKIIATGDYAKDTTLPLLKEFGVGEDAVSFLDARTTEEEARGLWEMFGRSGGVEAWGVVELGVSDLPTRPLTHF